MTLFDWLVTPDGAALVHAITFLLIAIAAWFSYKAHEQGKSNAEKLDQHMRDSAKRWVPTINPEYNDPQPKG